MPAAFGFILFIAALVWLYKAKARDVARCASVLGLTVVRNGEQRRGATSEGFDFHESVVMSGMLQGQRVEVTERILRFPVGARARRNRGSNFTVLSLIDVGPVSAFRLQPVGVLGTLEGVLHTPLPAVPTDDPAFDAAFRLSAIDATAALSILNSQRRRALLEFRDSVAAPLASPGTLAALASGLLLGTFESAPGRVSYAIFGTPSAAIGHHLAKAAAILTQLR